MKYKWKNNLSSTVFALATTLASVTISNTASAVITLDEAKKVTLFGDVRLRAERDDRSDDNNDGQTDRGRLRLRARIGVGFKATDEWSAKIRLATNATSLNSPYKTFSTTDTGSNGDFGLDQAYIAYTGVDQLTLLGGKTALNYWQQNELFWDQDINPDALAAIYKITDFTLNAAYVVVADGNWTGDTSVWIYQGVYKNKVSVMDYTLALGGASLSFPTLDTYQAETHVQLSGQIKTGVWLAGVDYLDSDASQEDTAYVLQGRYKVNKKHGLRLYYYHVEAFAPLGDGDFSQDNWPNPGNTGASNFEGLRYQYDYNIDTNTTLDVRYYDAERIKDKATLATTTSDAIMSRKEHSRFQLNLTVKF